MDINLRINSKVKRMKSSDIRINVVTIVLLCSALFLLGSCAKLPDNNQKTVSLMISDGNSTALGQAPRQGF